MSTLLYILRHGETDQNRESRVQGRLDAPLNENGERTAIMTGKALKDIRFDRVISSPLKRAYRTAELILGENRASRVAIETDDRLMEISFGAWEGLSCFPGRYEIPMERFQAFFYDPMHYRGAPEGERIQDVIDRTGAFLRELLADDANHGKTILISTHGCAMRALLQPVYEDKLDFWHGKMPSNCTVNVLSWENGTLTLQVEDAIYYDSSLGLEVHSV